ncbi:hypothetical protein PHSY_006645 [Pseudozyma hubeiensis SY62]|uniref:Uncharacterized protein n=1 Tax=Pseudozyma hubeiensis (strain SY62) TaxID=1305764 RepID=R9PCA8_PSEHS|nr:hypothetical protein PHSY_006645 [Pseudozyma hubeiensis SY62]GAC99048.1 hypothetical protein PHSY_006645 [Pseudozyma hubeiensis SY62]
MGMPAVGDSSNMGAQLQNAAQMVQLQLAVASTRCPRRRAPLAPSGKQTLPPSSSVPASPGGAHDAALSSGVTTTVVIAPFFTCRPSP